MEKNNSGSKNLAMNEANHVLDLMKQLKTFSTNSNEFNDLESELFSHFSNISGLINTLKVINDEETNLMIQSLEKNKETFFEIRKIENNSEKIDNNVPLANGSFLNELNDVDPMNQHEPLTHIENPSQIKDDFCSSIIVAIFICILIAVGWGYFSRE